MDKTKPVETQTLWGPTAQPGLGGNADLNGITGNPVGTDNAHSQPRHNHLLASLPDADWLRWQPLLERVDLRCGQVLIEAGSPPQHLYFPTTAVVSLVYLTRDGGCTEVAVVGNDGAMGIALIMGGSTSPSQAVVQTAGQAYRLRAQAVRDELMRPGPAFQMLLGYTQVLMAQVAQTALCNRFHTIDQQFSRRLLLGLDRQAGDALAMTQEAVANMLGVRREGVTAAASKLQSAGVIRYHRGRIEILDRQRLEQRACECYAMGHHRSPTRGSLAAPTLPLLPPLHVARKPAPAKLAVEKSAPAVSLWQRWPQAYAA